MDLTQLANLGEFIGGVAVLVTLIYLAVQVRQTKDVVRMEAARSTSQDYKDFLFQMMHPERMKVLRQGINNFDEMSANDQAQFHVYLAAVFIAAQNTFSMGRRGATEQGMTEIVESFNWALLRSPGAASWWASYKRFMPEDFVVYVDEKVAEQTDLPNVPEALSWYRWESTETRP